ncbi:MAG: bifunctional 2-polyprenyl-6-hydroxyphenol methylase/3-demethylubiquinol 3-O-methyltransferase UbiG [Hyphomicrobiaceae bacterium]|nr:bifunctional 2-polyprenyl-6-hydroxyphenol methylase/3-demethylubiquinol 3-O-methyltransferase UbiG [Hyphomicrobiaceae bacterium]MCC0023855.1 bifunctional 2-polyprenyl-6-hydroxyphenol methylase/3-demethylubiquinol 3-O-methyltransferase UbiG [Hyphomicrobiaceae bacterium]
MTEIASTQTTINQAELDKFTAMAEQWWDPTGKFKPLHKFNPVRLAYIREVALEHFDRDGTKRRPFEGLSMIDIGCGGGLLCEPMTRLGFDVTGIDAAARNIGIASVHAEQSGLDVDYRATTAEDMVREGRQYDMVLNMEVVEHVDNVPFFLKSCAALVKPGGLLLTATINRTARAFALAIVGAEYVLNWLPKGTHSYAKFLAPEEIASMLKREGLEVKDKCGVTFSPLHNEWSKSRDMGVNYMLLAEKPVQ